MELDDYKIDEELKKVDSTTSIYTLIKREHTYLRANYKLYVSKIHPNAFATILAEIFDKIYLIKIFIFLKKFEIFSVHLSLNMFYHILLLSLICGFFTINTIKKIWENENFPTINFYLLYGFISNIIIWVIYKIFLLLLDNQDKIRALIQKKENLTINIYMNRAKENDNDSNVDLSHSNNNNQLQQDIGEKYQELIRSIRIQMAIFYIVIILFTGFCSIYLVTFCAFYTGTKKFVFKTYYISIIEIALIKLVYGLSLASLRIAAERNEFKGLYNFVYICDKYIS